MLDILVVCEVLKLDKSISIIESQLLNIFSVVSIELFHLIFTVTISVLLK